MKILDSKMSRAGIPNLQYAQVACVELASVQKRSNKAKLGLKRSAQILLEIIKVAQNSKFYRAACHHVADQAFHLLNAIDGGVQGRAIDVNNILRDYVTRLNEDFLSMQKILQGFTSWWSFSRFWAASGEIQKCHDLVEYGMAMYLLLLRCSIAHGDQRIVLRWQYSQAVAQYLGQKPSLSYSIRAIRHEQQPLKSSIAGPSVRSPPFTARPSGPKRMRPQVHRQIGTF